MAVTDISPGPPIPGGSRWLKVTSPHPGQVVKIKRSNGLSVFYVQERGGTSQGKTDSRVHTSSYAEFLRDFEPYSKRDWNLAQKVMATLENPPAAATVATEQAAPAEQPTTADNGVASVASVAQDDIDVWDATVTETPSQEPAMPVPDKDAPPPPIEEAREIEAEAARRWRSKPAEFTEAEMDEIVELWRASINGDERSGDIGDIATTYGTAPATIYAVINQRVPQEYLLQRVVDQLRRNAGPIPAYRISQWMHLRKDEVEALCTSEAAQKVLRYTVETNDPARPWIRTPMVELLSATTAPPAAMPVPEVIPGPEPEPVPVPTPPEPTPEPIQPEPIQEEAPVATVSPAVEEAAPPMPEPTPITRSTSPGRTYTWRVTVRTTVEDRIEAADVSEALDAIKAKYADKPAMVVSVLMEE